MTRADMQTILRSFGLRAEVESWIIQICDGYPKLARVLAEESKNKTENLTRDQLIAWLADNEIFRDETVKDRGWVNLILDENDQEVLGVLALLTEIGHKPPRDQEYRNICEFFELKIEAVERSIAKHLKKGLLTEGSDYVYVTPLILASYLCSSRLSSMRPDRFEGLANVLRTFPRAQFAKSALESFSERIKMSGMTEEVQEKLLRVLDGFRPFDRAVLQSEVVAELAFACSHFQPQYFLTRFLQDLKSRSSEEIREWTEGRRSTVRFLEMAMYYPDLFDQAASALYVLAKAENETWANNAAGIWAGLFDPGLSGSMAPLEQRVNWLNDLIRSGEKYSDLLGKALDELFHAEGGGRSAGHENQLGLPSIEPKWGFKWADYYNALLMTIESIKTRADELPELLVNLIGHLRSMVRCGFLQKNPDVLDWLHGFGESDPVLQQKLLIGYGHIKEWESGRLTPELKIKIDELVYELESGSFENLVRRWSFDPTVDDDFREEKLSESTLPLLLKEVISNPEKIQTVREILISKAASRSWFVMYKIGEQDTERRCWPELLKWANSSPEQGLVGRYLVGRSAGKEDPSWVDDNLDQIEAKCVDLDSLVATSKDIETDRSFARVLRLAKQNPYFVRLLNFGGRASRLTEDQLQRLVNFFQELNDVGSLSAMWDVLGQFIHGHKDEPLPLSKDQLTFLSGHLLAPTKGNMTDHYQDIVLQTLLKHHMDGETISVLSNACIAIITDNKSDFHRSKRCSEILKALAESWPEEVFQSILKHLDVDDGLALLRMDNFLDDWVMGIFEERLLALAQTCDEQMGAKLARMIPDGFGALNDLSAMLVRRFPASGEISGVLFRSFFSGLFSGRIVDRYSEQLKTLDEWSSQNKIGDSKIVKQLRESLVVQLEQSRKEQDEEDFLNKRDR